MKLKFVDWKKMYDPEKVISSSEYYDNKKQFTPNGLFSETIFGKNSDPEGADKIGWINMGDIQIISPIFFERLKKVLKGSVLNRIINYNKKTDEFGDLVDEKMKGKDIEYQNIGIPGFIKNFEDIINLYGNTECNEYPVVMNAYHNDILFTNILPVFSSKLRPGILYGGNSKDKDRKAVFKYDDINNYYNIIIQYSNKIKDMDEDPNDNDYKLVVYPMITELQNYANNILKFIINNFLKGKKGMFRKEIAATRVNFSSRNVLTPLQDAEMDKISLPYLTFLELYRFLLINLMVKNEGISYVEADQYIQNCKTHFDKKLYKYMLMLVEHGKLRILLNRNP